MRIAIRVDVGPLIGGGHAMRCLTLATALASKGAKVTFVSATMPDALEERITSAGHRLVRIAASSELEREGDSWHEPALSDRAQSEDARATREAVGSADWIVVDHYLLDAHWHSAAREFAAKLMVIDDLANRRCECDLLLDQTLGRSASDYRALVPAAAKILAGPTYALLRGEFARQRRAALECRQAAHPPQRILISLGTADLRGVTAKIVEDLVPLVPHCTIDVVLGPLAGSLDALRAVAERHMNVRFELDSRDMAQLMRDADLAIGAAGATSWERCCLGLPSIALVLAENQRVGALALAKAGAAVALSSADGITAAVQQLISDPVQLARMSAAAFAIADARGTDRVVACILGEEQSVACAITLRPAEPEDAEQLWLWRNEFDTRKQSRSTEPIEWAAHLSWLSSPSPGRRIFVAERAGEPVGTIRFDPGDNCGEEISITVAPQQRGSRIGTAMLNAALAQANTQRIHASVRIENEASRRLFESCGFKRVESTEPGFLRYALTLEQCRRKQA